MKSILPSALAMLGLAMAPFAAFAQDDDAVSYNDAMECSALFSVLAGASEGSDANELEDMATRWLVVAMNRDGTADGSKAESELGPLVDELINALEEAPDEASSEEFLNEGISFCETKHEMIADEIDSIEL